MLKTAEPRNKAGDNLLTLRISTHYHFMLDKCNRIQTESDYDSIPMSSR